MSEWKTEIFENIFDIPLRNGLTKPSKVRGTGLRMVNMKEIFGYDVINDLTEMECVPVTEKDLTSLLDFDDLIFARQSLVESGAGKIAIYKGKKPTVFESHLIRCRINQEKAVPDYIYYFWKSPSGKGLISSIVTQTAAAGIKGSVLQKLPILLPPLPEQRAIAGVLSSLDDKIDLLRRENRTLEAMAETLFRQWFVEEADEGWEEGKLPDEFDFTMGQSPEGASFNEDGVGTPMFQGNADFGFRFPTMRVYTTNPTRFALPMDTLISVRAPVGAQNMAGEKCCIGRGLSAFRYKKNHSHYTYTYFKLRSLLQEITQFNDEGTVFGSISKNDFENINVLIPDEKMILRFETEVGPMNDKVIANCSQIEQLTILRDTLLPKLMSGEVLVAGGGPDA